jgi:hypothetical protein
MMPWVPYPFAALAKGGSAFLAAPTARNNLTQGMASQLAKDSVLRGAELWLRHQMLGYHWPSALEETVLPFFCGLFNHIASGQPGFSR